MPYIKLLTALAGLALLTACGGAAKTADNAGKSANPCIENPFGATCSADDSTIISLRQSVCLADTTINPACTGEAGIATVFCKANPFNTSKACVADTGAIRQRQNQCLDNANINLTCGAVIANFCKTNPFQESACLPNDTYLPARIAECITGGKADSANCGLITTKAGKNTALTSCLTNPFAEVCETSVPDFTSSFEQARTNRLGFCNDNANVADDLCTGDNVGIICGSDPFNAICFTGNTYFSARVNNCITAGNANSNNNCNTVFTESASNTCLTNPFTDACTNDADFGTYATTARMTRVTFCGTNSSDTICDTLTACQNNPFATECEAYFQTERDSREDFCDMAGNVGNALCMGASRVGVCGSDPFNASCFTDATYLPARFNNCITGGNAGDMKCDIIVSDSTMNAEITACLTNPFTDACARNADFDDYADMARANRVAFCESGSGELCTPLTTCNGNPFHESCGAYFDTAKLEDCAKRTNVGKVACTTSILSNPNAATWAQSFTTALSTTPATTNTPLRGFLQGGATTVDFGSLRLNNGSNPVVRTLNLKDATYDDVPLGGDKEDGLAYFEARVGNADGGYAGILSGTNLGAPLPAYVAESEPVAVWKGKFGVGGSARIVNRDFNLNVNLQTRKINAFVQFAGTSHYKLDGDFNDEGLIVNGTVIYGIFTNREQDMLEETIKSGILTGLIGQEGAVGVFHSNNDNIGTSSYTGGFVACPYDETNNRCQRPE
ncbi:MAG: hypothetical protein ACNYPD_06135 [Candidatus Halichondribacter symbioticus]